MTCIMAYMDNEALMVYRTERSDSDGDHVGDLEN